MLDRVDNWPQELEAYIRSIQDKPFKWGEHDCVLGALGCAEAILKADFTSNIRGKYTTALGAAKRMKVLFGAVELPNAADAFRSHTGSEPIQATFAQRGDIVEAEVQLPDGGLAPALGFIGLDNRYGLFVGPAGLTKIPISQCSRAWRVGL